MSTKDEAKRVVVSVGPGLSTILFVTLFVMKITGVIGWSWWWVASPLWIPPVLIVSVVGVGVLAITAFFGVSHLIDKIDAWRKSR